jgi:uncharacterized membrane protein
VSASRRRSTAKTQRPVAAPPPPAPTLGGDGVVTAVEEPEDGTPASTGEVSDGGIPSDVLDGAPPGPRSWVPWMAFVLCLLGLADSIYLVYVHYHPGALVCSTTGTFDCTAVQTSPQSMVFGVIPVAWLGLAYFIAMTSLFVPRVWRMADIRLVWLRMAGAVVGMGMVIYLVIAELFQIKAICEYCTGVHAITFVLFVTTMLSYPALSYRARWVAWAAQQQ